MEKEKYTEQEKEEILEKFSDKLVNNQKDIPEEFAKIVNENFWDLLY